MPSSQPNQQQPHEIHLHDKRTERKAEDRKLGQLKERLRMMAKVSATRNQFHDFHLST